MNLDSPEFVEQLRQATSRRDPPVSLGPLDPEVAALRSGFLALGKALEAATDDVNERHLVASLTQTLALETDKVRKQARESADEQRTMLWLAATAALLLLTVGVVAYATRGTATTEQVAQPNKVTPEPNSPEVVPPAPDFQSDVPQVASDEGMMSEEDDVLEWNDSLDDTFTAAERLVSQAGRLSSAAEARVENLYKKIQAASEDVQSGSL